MDRCKDQYHLISIEVLSRERLLFKLREAENLLSKLKIFNHLRGQLFKERIQWVSQLVSTINLADWIQFASQLLWLLTRQLQHLDRINRITKSSLLITSKNHSPNIQFKNKYKDKEQSNLLRLIRNAPQLSYPRKSYPSWMLLTKRLLSDLLRKRLVQCACNIESWSRLRVM